MAFWGKKSPYEDPTSIGNLLLRGEFCTPEELKVALLFQQKNPNLSLGQILVDMGVIGEEILVLVLVQQEIARKPTRMVVHKIADLAVCHAGDLTGTMQEVRSLVNKAAKKLK